MTDYAQPPDTGRDYGALFGVPEAADFPAHGHLARTQHLTLPQYAAYAVLQDLIDQYGVRQILDDEMLVCRVLRCTVEHWHDDIGPAVVPLLDVDAGGAA